MNKLDINLKNLITTFKLLTKEMIYNNIKNNYLKIDDSNKKAIENFLDLFNYWGKIIF